MKKNICAFIFLFSLVKLFSLDFSFTGSASTYASLTQPSTNGFFANVNKDLIQAEMMGLLDTSFTLYPIDNLYAQIDLSCYGSMVNYNNNNQKQRTSFFFDINQLYLNWNLNNSKICLGKKVFNFGYNNFFPLVNIVNQRRNDIVSTIYEGTGALFFSWTPFSFISFSELLYFESNDLEKDLDDISLLSIIDIYYNNFGLSLYSYILDIKEFNNFPIGISMSIQFDYLTIYSELMMNMKRTKYGIVQKNENISIVEKETGFDFNASLGFKYYKSDFYFIAEYCFCNNGYTNEESSDIANILNNVPAYYNSIYNKKSNFFNHNIALLFNYTFISNLSLTVSDIITFPNFDDNASYVGNTVTLDLSYLIQQVLQLQSIFKINIGGNNSEACLYNGEEWSLVLGAKILL
ncbi:hypothetical protein [Treponema bryantii]|uniref:hypothetical protein n=1 Tax=Treponema bryantii TaxID=163 RepID=UPI002B32500F|nr:hypothetical protein TRBR_25910 [Treponema bryantii]